MQTIGAWRLPAPAKLNLMLRIVGRRNDGYHLLQTVFQFVDHCDWITLHPRDDAEIRLKSPLPGVPEESDLTVRAARAIRKVSGVTGGVTIEVEKNLPMGGGLGGGSSDAATVLVGLNRLWRCGLSHTDLQSLGLELGADVPVFIAGHSAWAEGVGEDLTVLDLPEPWYVVLVPDCQVSTGQIFGSPDLTRNSQPLKMTSFFDGHTENDCQSTVVALYPRVAEAIRDLSQHGQARLTGTGACVFAAFETEAEAKTVAGILDSKWKVFVAKGLNRSPLLDALTLEQVG